ncbi:Phosphoribosylformimino-5-aminoimidazole carboxamide ribotide isomerase [Phellopilus nigrolimitatus]|nr:Phosphoribosylformimino-5-aminoimidazole carboxamide ribotide isomerase [Phellopilus nigrolimitatus]
MSTARRRSVFRPVKQIVGGTLSGDAAELKTNFVARHSPAHFARLYARYALRGGHVIKLGLGNDDAARTALAAWPGGLQVGGGITDNNAADWLGFGASKVIVTSFLFPSARFSLERLQALSQTIGKDKLVVDISCRRRGTKWLVAMNKWQDITDMEVCQESLDMLSDYCSEFLIHAADVEGLCRGIDEELVSKLGQWVRIPTTYAGGARDLSDLALVDRLSGGRVDLTYGSSLDIFGGSLVNFEELVSLNKEHAESNASLC